MLNIKVWALSLGGWMAATFTICVLMGVLVPGLPALHRTLEVFLPAFVWITPWSFVLGLVESFFIGVYAGALFVVIHNFFARRLGTSGTASRGARAA